MNIKNITAVDNKKDPSKIKWVRCPTCRTMTCFNTENPIVNIMLCKALKKLRQSYLMDQTSSNIASNQSAGTLVVASPPNQDQNDVGPFNDSSAGENDATSSASEATVADTAGSDGEGNMIDLSHDDEEDDSPDGQANSQSVTHVLRRSQRTRRPTVPHDVLEDTTVVRDAKRSRMTVARDAVGRGVIVSEQQTEESDGSSLSITVSSPDTVTANQLWKQEISREGVNVFRIRCYNTECVATSDEYGRRMSQWCVNNGMVITDLELAKILPRHQWWDGELLQDRVASVNHQELRQICRESQHYPPNEMPYVRSYKEFVDMKKGDIVVLHTKGGYTKSGPPQTLTFGVIQDDTLTAMDREEMKQKNCPWDLINYGEQTTSRIGIMLKKVKWLRQGELKAVRGPRQVNWLAEAQPLWLMRVGTTEDKFLKQAIKKMGSEQFFRNTRLIDNNWTMG